MTRRAYVYFVVTFVLGIVVGAGGFFSYALRTGNWRPPFNRQRVVKTLTHDLNLSSPQISELERIMDENDKQHRVLETQMDQQFGALREQNRNRIRQILNPDQLARFNEIVREHDERRRRARRP